MGISGLLPFIKPVTKKCHIKEFTGESLAIDSFILLHKASLIHGDFEENSGKQKLLSYLTKWLDMFDHFEVTPYFVLDGSALKSKEVTNEARRKVREQLKAEAEKLLAKGRKSEAYEAIRKSRGVTPVMIEIFLNLLKERDIQFVVAPFEADAQLAYLAREKFVKGVVTEDSDLLVFGCPLVIFKLDPEGKCDKVLSDDLFAKKSSPFFNMDLDKMRQICILSGCDYLPNIPSLGLKTSHKLFSELQTLQAVREFLESKDKYKIPPSYWTDFNMANETFLYQKVYCPTGKILKNLNLLEAGVECIEYLRLEETVEELERFNKIVRGECCPKTMVPYNFIPGPTPTIIQPKDNPLLRVTTPSAPGPRQTLLNKFTKIEISSAKQDSDNLISDLYKLKGKADSEEVSKKEEEEAKEVKTPIKIVSPFFSKGNVSKLIKLTNNSSINNNIKIKKGTGEDITLIEVNSSPESSNQLNDIILIKDIKEEKVKQKEKVIIKEIKPNSLKTIIDVDLISSISKKRQFNEINLIDSEEDNNVDFIDEIED